MLVIIGPTCTVFFETLGDPLLICFILFLGYALLMEQPMSSWLAVCLTSMYVVLSCLLHEASLFIFVPAAFWILSYRQKKGLNFIPLIIIMVSIVLLLSYGLPTQSPTRSSAELMTRFGQLQAAMGEALPGFKSLLIGELYSYFNNSVAIKYFIIKIISFLLWPCVFYLVCICLRPVQGRNFTVHLAVFFLISLPLYGVAHDWGRFITYTMGLAFITSSMGPLIFSGGLASLLNSIFDGFARLSVSLANILGVFFLYGLSLFYFSHDTYRIGGITAVNLKWCAILIITYLVYRVADFIYIRKAQNR